MHRHLYCINASQSVTCDFGNGDIDVKVFLCFLLQMFQKQKKIISLLAVISVQTHDITALSILSYR